MNKKLIALAVAGATFAPAVMAQSANPVTLYGRAWEMVNAVKADGGATLPNETEYSCALVARNNGVTQRGHVFHYSNPSHSPLIILLTVE